VTITAIDQEDQSLPDERARYARQIMGQALLLGVFADTVLRHPPWGIGLTIWVAALAITTTSLVLRRGAPYRREPFLWLGAAVICALALAVRDAEMLQFFNVLATVFALTLLSMLLAGAPAPSIWAARIRDVVVAWAYAVRDAVGGVVPLVFRDTQLESVIERSGVGRPPVVRAILLTVPLVLVFGALLRQADPAFASLLRLPEIDLENVVSHVVVAGIFAWITSGWLRGALVAGAGTRRRPSDEFPLTLGVTEISASLGSLNALFALFVGVQLGWLFGGADVVRETTGLSVAEYARRGFFELVFVAALVFPVILGTRATIAGDDAALRRHRRLALPLLALLGAIMLSAVLRMRLYVQYFGLTTDRLYALVGMLWLAFVFLCMAMTVLRGWTRPFAAMAVLSAFATVFALNLVSPEALVARVDLSPSRTARPVDYKYLASLSGDAAPIVARALAGAAPSVENCRAALSMRARWISYPQHWTQWNVAAARARSVVLAQLTPLSLRRLCGYSRT
jgi:hypothetical protein